MCIQPPSTADRKAAYRTCPTRETSKSLEASIQRVADERFASATPPATDWRKVPMSAGLLLVSLATSLTLSFLFGRCTGIWLRDQDVGLSLSGRRHHYHHHQHHQQQQQQHGNRNLSPLVLGPRQQLPSSTSYSSKEFGTKGLSSDSSLARSAASCFHDTDLLAAGSAGSKMSAEKTCSTNLHASTCSQDHRHRYLEVLFQDKQHLQHITTSEALVADLLNALLESSHTPMLSYHCHTVAHRRISCTAVAHRGHVVLHTFADRLSLSVYGVELDSDSTQDLLGQPLMSMPITNQDQVPSLHQSSISASSSFQSTKVTEAFVHPALLSQATSKVVLVLGGSLATVQEILQYNTVERLILIESPNKSQEWLNYDIDSMDPRIEAVSTSAYVWLTRHKKAHTKAIDVVLVENIEILDTGNSTNALQDLAQILDTEGMMVVQTSLQLPEHNSWRHNFVAELQSEELESKFAVIREYDEGSANFIVAFASNQMSIGRWFANQAELALAIRERMSSVDASTRLDTSRLRMYQYPSRRAENIFCKGHPDNDTCEEGHGLDPNRPSVPLSLVEVKESTIPNAGRGIFAKENIQQGSYMFLDGCVDNINMPDPSIRIIEFFSEGDHPDVPVATFETLMWYADGYGFASDHFGARSYDVDPDIATFVNHGCNGTTNVGTWEHANLTENSAHEYGERLRLDNDGTYNPAKDRMIRSHGCTESIAMRNIFRGEEIFNNYMTFEADDLEAYAASLREECAGTAYGQVSEYEMTHSFEQQQTAAFVSSSTPLKTTK